MFDMSPEMFQVLQELAQRKSAPPTIPAPATTVNPAPAPAPAAATPSGAQRPLRRLLQRFIGQRAER